MLRTIVLTGLAFGVIMALSSAPSTAERSAPGVAMVHAAGLSLSADLGEISRRGPYLQVEARFLKAGSGNVIKVLPIALREGEAAAFSIPGYPEQTFQFERKGDEVLVDVKTGRSILARLLG